MLRVLFLVFLVVSSVCAANAQTSVISDCTPDGNTLIFDYILFAGDTDELITAFHVFAPVDYRVVKDWSANDGWSFSASRDAETGGADFCWYSADGLSANDMLMCSIITSSNVSSSDTWKKPGCEGNWGYEVVQWPDAVAVLGPSVDVPVAAQINTPEPGSIFALMSGFSGLFICGRRRR